MTRLNAAASRKIGSSGDEEGDEEEGQDVELDQDEEVDGVGQNVELDQDEEVDGVSANSKHFCFGGGFRRPGSVCAIRAADSCKVGRHQMHPPSSNQECQQAADEILSNQHMDSITIEEDSWSHKPPGCS